MAQPREDVLGIFRQAHNLVEKFDRQMEDPDMGYIKKMLFALEEPYGKMNNEDEMYDALCGVISEQDAEVWFAFPDFSLKGTPITAEEAAANVRPELGASIDNSIASLKNARLLLQTGKKEGKPAYMRNYMFYLVLAYVNGDDPKRTPLGTALLNWWIYTNEGGSADFPTGFQPYRIIPHEGTVTGRKEAGRIPMNLEIPDTREVLDMDRLSRILSERRSIAVTKCICRNSQEKNGTRKCDYPLEVCIGFDAVADGMIATGAGKRITAEECERIVKTSREMGLMQIISNSEEPLAMCNCCKCCCGVVKSMARFETTVGTVSRYIAQMTDPSECIRCKACVKVCPMETISIRDGHAEIFGGKCFGCGLCVSKCPEGILRMAVRGDAVQSTYSKEPEPRLYI